MSRKYKGFRHRHAYIDCYEKMIEGQSLLLPWVHGKEQLAVEKRIRKYRKRMWAAETKEDKEQRKRNEAYQLEKEDDERFDIAVATDTVPEYLAEFRKKDKK